MSVEEVEETPIDDSPYEVDELEQDLNDAFDQLEAEEDEDLEEPELEASEDAEPVEISEDPAEEVAESEDTSAEESQEALQPPASFNATEREDFHSSTRVQQEASLRLEASRRAHFHQQTQGESEGRRLYSEIEDVYTSVKPLLNERGVSLKQFIKGYYDTEQYMKTNPLQAATALLQRMKIHPSQLLNGAQQNGQHQNGVHQQPQQGQGVYRDPRVDDIVRHYQQQQVQAQHRDAEEKFNSISSYKDEKDESGQLVRPLMAIDDVTGNPVYPEFYQRMCLEVSNLKNQGGNLSNRDALEAAYATSLHATEVGRASLNAQREREARAEAAQKVKEAKRAATSPSPSKGAGGSATDSYATLDDEIDAATAGW